MKWFYIVLLSISSIVVVGLVIFIIAVTLKTKAPKASIIIKQNASTLKPRCTSMKTNCNTDQDCAALCLESDQGESMVCQDFARYTDEQEQMFGSSEKICVPENAVIDCNEDNGGLLVLSGQKYPDRLEWDCICSFPSYYNGPSCEQLNDNVCAGGTFNWSATSGKAPSADNCTCPEFLRKIVNHVGIPMCVNPNQTNWYT